ncbi:MAG: maltotransferase domain-containing protein, partial [Persicimonas sp.]
EYTVRGWVDHFQTWRADLKKRLEADQDLHVELVIGARLLEQAAARAERADAHDDAERLRTSAEKLRDDELGEAERSEHALDEELAALVARWPDRRFATTHDPLPLEVERRRARFSSWYEVFPRSTSPDPGRHGTFSDLRERLPYIAKMGFDIVYLPPIHPIGRVHRKGKNNARSAEEDDVGSPWAIGAKEGGHKAIHPKLGTPEDFEAVVERARKLDMEIALDIAFQAAPDHPYVDQHPEWFRERPDGTIQYAENPPKKYEDIYPFDFETDQWPDLWRELESVVRHWCEMGVRAFRVDNPHTKPFAFWEWLIPSIKADFPETIFLSEAFTRPRVMQYLAKIGFSQSYTYFAWRNTKHELLDYLHELTHTDVVEYMRPNFWPNTPDILTEQLQTGERATFMVRLVLAATMTANYGIYGPAFELMEHVPVHPGSEEYLDSEKYQLRHWDLDAEHSLAGFIGHINRIRRENPALQQNRRTTIHHTNDDQLIAYSKRSADGSNVILIVANLDAEQTRADMVELDLNALGVDPERPFQVRDLIDGELYMWQGRKNYVELDPDKMPVHVFRVGDAARTEDDFDPHT